MILNFDESGNLGKKGRYFTIACVAGSELKPLKNVMNRSITNVKNKFPQFKDSREIKASESNPIIKDYMLRKIATKNIEIRYIVADLVHVQQHLLKDENLLYNYMLKFLVLPICKSDKPPRRLVLNIDKRTIKVGSTNSFTDYIKILINYDLNLPIPIEVNYYESHNSVQIQAADFVANAINAKYEYNHDYYYNLIKKKITHSEQFPYRLFGSDKVLKMNSL